MVELRVKIYDYDNRITHTLTGRGETVGDAQRQALAAARKLLGVDTLEVKSWEQVGKLKQ